MEGSTDITRTTVLGHITPELKKYFVAVYRAMQHLSATNFLYGNHGWVFGCIGKTANLGYEQRLPVRADMVSDILEVSEPPTGFTGAVLSGEPEHPSVQAWYEQYR